MCQKSDRIRVSIIIPHYNSCELAIKLLESIPVREEIQVILVDDNSTENTDVLKEHAQRRGVDFYQSHSTDHSAGHCRNIGLDHAVGEWLLFADADDYFIEGFYEIIRTYFDQNYDLVYFLPTSQNLKDGTVSNRHVSYGNLIHNYMVEPNKKHEILLRYENVVPWSKMIKGSVVRENEIRFDETRVANDVMFSVQCANCAKEIATSDKTIYCVTKGNTSLTASVNREDVRTRIKVEVKKYKFLKRHVDHESWEILDLRINRYGGFFKKYKVDTRDKLLIYGYMIINGVRLCQINIYNFFPKLIKKIQRKSS